MIVGEGDDLLILLPARAPIDKTYPIYQNHVLFLNAITGFDSSLAFFKIGKTTVFKLFEKIRIN